MKKDPNPSIYDSIIQMTNRFFSDLIKPGSKEKKETLEFNFEEVSKFHHNSPSVIFVFNHQTLSYDYFSENVKEVMGYENKDFQEGGLKFAMSLVHPDHTKIYNRYVLPIMFKYYSIYALKGKIKDLKFSYTFKIKKNDGEYIWALHHMNAIKTNMVGLPALTMLHMNDVTEIKTDEKVNINVSLKETDTYKTIYSRVFGLDNNFSFSDRELEILELIAKGKTSKQISIDLSISMHTVISHRKRMMEKSNVKNSSELIQMAYKQSLISENYL